MVAGGVLEQAVRLLGREAEAEQAVARQRARVVGGSAPDHDLLAHPAGHLLAQLDDHALGGALADPRHGLEAGRVARGDGVEQLARPAAREHREGDLRPDALDADQHQEELALGLGREAEQVHAVVAKHEVRVEHRLLADAGGAASVSLETARR